MARRPDLIFHSYTKLYRSLCRSERWEVEGVRAAISGRQTVSKLEWDFSDGFFLLAWQLSRDASDGTVLWPLPIRVPRPVIAGRCL